MPYRYYLLCLTLTSVVSCSRDSASRQEAKAAYTRDIRAKAASDCATGPVQTRREASEEYGQTRNPSSTQRRLLSRQAAVNQPRRQSNYTPAVADTYPAAAPTDSVSALSTQPSQPSRALALRAAPADSASTTYTSEAATPVQRFWVQPGRDTVLRCAAGTLLLIPANAFVAAKRPVTGTVEVRVREFYTLADILLNNLSTTSGGQLLETGGMVHLAAYAGRQACELQPDKELGVLFPAAQPKPDMRLYTGVHTAPNRLDWRLPAQGRRRVHLQHAPIQGPRFARGEGIMRRELARAVAYSPTMAAHLSATHPSSRIRRMLRRSSRELHQPVTGEIRMRFELSAAGAVENPSFMNSTDSLLAGAMQAAVPRMSAWRPASEKGQPVRSVMWLTTDFTANGQVLVRRVGWDEWATSQALVAARFRQRFERLVTNSTMQQTRLSDISGYLLSTGQLGWLNCDRGVLAMQPIDTRVPLDTPDTHMWLVLRNSRTILSGYVQGRHMQFSNVPEGEPATLVALRQTSAGPQLATRPVVLSRRLDFPPTAFQPVTMELLRAKLAELDAR